MTVDINPKANCIWFKPLIILFGAILLIEFLTLIMFINKMKHLKLDLTKAQEAYKKGDQSIKDFLINAYGKENFLLYIKDRVTDYESACAELGIKPLTESDFGILPKEDRFRAFNRHQVVIGVRALNEGWKANMRDGEWKYYNVPYAEGALGFSFFVHDRRSYCSFCGADLLYKNRELCEYGQMIFKQQYINFSF